MNSSLYLLLFARRRKAIEPLPVANDLDFSEEDAQVLRARIQRNNAAAIAIVLLLLDVG